MAFSLLFLFELYYNPVSAITKIRSRAPYLIGAVLAVLASFVYYGAFDGTLAALGSMFAAPGPYLFSILFKVLIAASSPIVFLAAIFVPAAILLTSLFDKRSSFGMLLRQEYSAFASCVFYAWAAAHLIMLAPEWLLYGRVAQDSEATVLALKIGQHIAPLPYFLFLVIVAVHAVLRQTYGKSTVVILLSTMSLAALPLAQGFLFLFSSPFLLILLFLFIRNFMGDMFSAQRERERFKQNLETATLNPADASAHYNLGLIYQHRGQYGEAKAEYERAVEIAPDEPDAHYQLGRIAREEGRLADAIRHFDAVVTQDPSHNQNEVWREVGRAYIQAGQFEDALGALERFLDKRPTDAEGRYHYALALYRLGRTDDAAGQMRAVIENVKTAPAYKYRAEKHWMSEAESFLRSLAN